MAKQLWILRHGDAEPHGARPDAERRLTDKGERQSRAAGRALERLGIEVQAVFSSPRVRALDTAKLACEALGCEPIVHQPLSSGFDEHDAAELLAGYDDEARVLVVGHEPDLSQLVYALTGARVEMKKGGLAGAKLVGLHGELLVLLRPSELRRIAGD